MDRPPVGLSRFSGLHRENRSAEKTLAASSGPLLIGCSKGHPVCECMYFRSGDTIILLRRETGKVEQRDAQGSPESLLQYSLLSGPVPRRIATRGGKRAESPRLSPRPLGTETNHGPGKQ